MRVLWNIILFGLFFVGLFVVALIGLGAWAVRGHIEPKLPGQMALGVGRIMDRLLEGGAPLLVHCTAGKDRTGFAVAVDGKSKVDLGFCL